MYSEHQGCAHCMYLEQQGGAHCMYLQQGGAHCMYLEQQGCAHCMYLQQGCAHCMYLEQQGCAHCMYLQQGCGQRATAEFQCKHRQFLHRVGNPFPTLGTVPLIQSAWSMCRYHFYMLYCSSGYENKITAHSDVP